MENVQYSDFEKYYHTKNFYFSILFLKYAFTHSTFIAYKDILRQSVYVYDTITSECSQKLNSQDKPINSE